MRWRAHDVAAELALEPQQDALTITYHLGDDAEPLSIEVELADDLLTRLELWLAAQGIARI